MSDGSDYQEQDEAMEIKDKKKARKIFDDTLKRISHPEHYTKHPSGIECIQITEHMNFCLGNAIKYIWRAGEKGNKIEDLKKAIWYITREINRSE